RRPLRSSASDETAGTAGAWSIPRCWHARTWARLSLLLRLPAREDAGDESEDVRRAFLVVAEVADEPALHHVDLLLRRLVHHVADEARQLDGVLLVFEELQLQRLLQALVRLVVELLAVDRQGADVVHDLSAEVVLAALRNVDLLLHAAHQPFVRLLVAAG